MRRMVLAGLVAGLVALVSLPRTAAAETPVVVTVTGEITKAKKPLAAAEVIVEEVEGNPGYYTSRFFLRPHYQLEGLSVSLRLVSKLPSAKG